MSDSMMREILQGMGLIANVSSASILGVRENATASAFDDRRDVDAECGYPDFIRIEDYQKMYDRNSIAARVVELMPTECWSEDPAIVETEEPEPTEFEIAFHTVAKFHQVFSVLEELDVLSGIGEYGVLFFGFNDGLDLDKPATKQEDMQLLYVRPFSQTFAKVVEWEKEKTNPRYGKPVMYEIQFYNPVIGGAEAELTRVHYTRVMHVTESLSNPVSHSPRLRTVWNELLNLRKTLGGSAEMFWNGAFPGMALQVLPDYVGQPIDKKSLRTEMNAYRQGLQRYFTVNGFEVKELSPQVADPTAHIESQLKAIALRVACPLRIFLGSEEAKLAANEDSKRWNKRVSRRRHRHCTPKLVLAFALHCIKYGVLPEPLGYEEDKNAGFDVQWPDLTAPTMKERTEIMSKMVDAIAKYIQFGADILVPPMEFMTIILGWEQEVADSVLQSALQQVQTGHANSPIPIGAEPAPADADPTRDPAGNQPSPDNNPKKRAQPKGRKNVTSAPSKAKPPKAPKKDAGDNYTS